MKFKLKAALAVMLALVMALTAIPVSALPIMEAERTAADNGERAIWDGSIATSFAGGTGMEDDPYLIANGAQLAYLAQQVNSGADRFENKHLKLTADIYLNDTTNWENWGNGAAPANEWTPIGFGMYNGAYSPYYEFRGVFDGCGNTVYGMYINTTACPEYDVDWPHEAPRYGLFGNTLTAYFCGEIHNLNVESSYIKVVGKAVIGLLAGSSEFVTNCSSNGRIVAEAYYDASEEYSWNRIKSATVGGLIGSGGAWKCENYASIYASNPSNVGGIAGTGEADCCINCGNIEVVPCLYYVVDIYDEANEAEKLSSSIGGISGYAYGDIGQCINKGEINIRLANFSNECIFAGGIAGRCSSDNYSCISDSYNAGNISVTIPDILDVGTYTDNEIEIGGIGGYYFRPSFCYNSGRINIYGDIDSLADTWGSYFSTYAVSYAYYSFVDTCYYLDADCYSGDESGIALTDAQMRDKSSFADFDFHNIWTIEPATAYPYPQLIRELDKSMGGSSAIWSGNAASGFASGSGTQSDPYIINTAEQLAYLAKSVNEGNSYDGKFIELNRDISLNNYNAKYWTLNATPWMPIGTDIYGGSDTRRVFMGSFDGNAHTIFGAYITPNGSFESMRCSFWGLFGNCENAIIKNLNIRNSFVAETWGSFGAGGLIGEIYDGSIMNCSSSAEIVSSTWAVGGIVGRALESTIESCYNTGTIRGYGDTSVSGIVGAASEETNIINCYNTGDIIGMNEIGGIAGSFITELGDSHAKVSKCYNIGRVFGSQYSYCGEIIGEALRYDVEGWYEPYDGNYFIQNGYYLDNCCAYGNGYGTALTDAQLRNQGSYAGFDFSSVWTMQGNDNYPYAELRSNPHGGIALPGDLDGNGSVSVADAISTLRLSMGISDGSGMNTDAADMDGNGNITLADAIIILRTAMGLA